MCLCVLSVHIITLIPIIQFKEVFFDKVYGYMCEMLIHAKYLETISE